MTRRVTAIILATIVFTALGAGTAAGNTPPDRRLGIRDGRFTLTKHATSSLSGLTYTYRLTGHTTAGGFVGTFHYYETDHRGYSCDVPLLHWSAAHHRHVSASRYSHG
jgi:hypothetical protein